MKKVLLLFLIFSCFLFTGCSLKRDTVSMEEFQYYTERKNYQFLDITSQFEYEERLKEAGLAASKYWHVELYIFDGDEGAMDTFQSNQMAFQETETDTSYSKELSGLNYETYSLTTSYEYMYVCRIDNTVLFARVPVEYRDTVIKFIEGLGY